MKTIIIGCLLVACQGASLINDGFRQLNDEIIERQPNRNLVQIKYVNNDGFGNPLNNQEFRGSNRNFNSRDFSQSNQFNSLNNLNQQSYQIQPGQLQGVSLGNIINQIENSQRQQNQQFTNRLNQQQLTSNTRFSNSNYNNQNAQKYNTNSGNQISHNQFTLPTRRNPFDGSFNSGSINRGFSIPQNNINYGQNQFTSNQNRINQDRSFASRRSPFIGEQTNFNNNFVGSSGVSRQSNFNRLQNDQNNQIFDNQRRGFNQGQNFVDFRPAQAFQGLNRIQSLPQAFVSNRNFQNVNDNTKISLNTDSRFNSVNNNQQLQSTNLNRFPNTNTLQFSQQDRQVVHGYIERENSDEVIGDIQSFSVPVTAKLAEGVVDSNFQCEQYGPGFYADTNSNCQLFHVCSPAKSRQTNDVSNYRFTYQCGANEQFDQQTMTCVVGGVQNCQSASSLFSASSQNSQNFFTPTTDFTPSTYSANERTGRCFLANNDHIITGVRK